MAEADDGGDLVQVLPEQPTGGAAPLSSDGTAATAVPSTQEGIGMAQDIRKSFHQELDEIQADIVRLGALVTECIPRATDALLTGNLREAQSVIDDDDALDELTLQIEERCFQVLALQQPMAGDLRAIITAIKMVSELERDGDLMVNVCKGARRIYGATIDPTLRGFIQRMSDESLKLTRLAIDAYAEGDESLAAALDDIDDRLDTIHAEYIQAIFQSHSGGNLDLQAAVQLALFGRYYERIGDHAVNIGERTVYMVTGWLPEHTGVARSRLRGESTE
jgi:phosphate transport system protein